MPRKPRATPRSRGRPPKISPTVIKRLVEAFQHGASQKVAAAYAGINEKTLITYLKRGETEALRLDRHPHLRPKEAEAPYLELFQRLKKAEGEAADAWARRYGRDPALPPIAAEGTPHPSAGGLPPAAAT